MFKQKNTIQKSKLDISNYVEDFDIYNSLLISKLKDPVLPREPYTINSNEFRPDLIAKDIYGSSDYLGILIITNSIGLEDYRRGVVLEVIPKNIIDSIINSLL